VTRYVAPPHRIAYKENVQKRFTKQFQIGMVGAVTRAHVTISLVGMLVNLLNRQLAFLPIDASSKKCRDEASFEIDVLTVSL